MWSGLMLILVGVLIYVHPRIVVALISGFLVASGIGLMLLHWRLRRTYRAWEQARSPWTRFIIRF